MQARRRHRDRGADREQGAVRDPGPQVAAERVGTQRRRPRRRREPASLDHGRRVAGQAGHDDRGEHPGRRPRGPRAGPATGQ